MLASNEFEMAFKHRDRSGCMYVTNTTGTLTLSLTSKGTEGFSANGCQENGTVQATSPICTASGM